ncbi:MAG: amino acid permease [Desulfuromonas sp.]|nr:amino acid permease [Desulfuromonas sp.]
MPQPTPRPTLKRSLTLIPLVMYGLGTTIGAGIYALVGELAQQSGMLSACSFIFAAILASLTALSFAELSSRFPQAAGAALYVQQGFHSVKLARFVGLLVVSAGAVSSAALINAFALQLQPFLDLPRVLLIAITTALLLILALWGIVQSVVVAGIITILEVGGLLCVIIAGHDVLTTVSQQWLALLPGVSLGDWKTIFSGGLLAFYAFIGFEDMVDVAEEVKNVQRTLPYAILITVVITSILYLLIMLSALLAMPIEQLATDPAPLTTLFHLYTGYPPEIMSIISLFAIINGALIQMIMVSRVLYGLSSRQQLPRWFNRIHPHTRTPTNATLTAAATIATLAFIGRLDSLAITTSLLMLCVFTLVNLALWQVKHQHPVPKSSFNLPSWWPFLAASISVFFLCNELVNLIFF